MEEEHLLEIRDLTVSFKIENLFYHAVENANLTISKGEVLAIVGESGSGKSALAMSILNLHNREKTDIKGQIIYDSEDLSSLETKKLNKIRGSEISMIFQDPMTALDPLMIVGKQIEETMYYHLKLDKQEMKKYTLNILNDLGFNDVEEVYHKFPHELSGGQRQRIVIAIAVINEPKLIIADEPTTALDTTIQIQVLKLLKGIQKKQNSGILIITHDLGVVAEIADRVAVMYAGEIVEIADVHTLFDNARHPYTKLLLQSMPQQSKNSTLHTIKGNVPSLTNRVQVGCRFSERIPEFRELVHEDNPSLHQIAEHHWVRCICWKNFELGRGIDEDRITSTKFKSTLSTEGKEVTFQSS